MSQFLTTDTFDLFLLEEAVINSANSFTIDGRVNQEFFEEPCKYDFRPWAEIKNLCFDLIKGKRTPLSFRFVLHLIPEKAAILLQKEDPDLDFSQIKALVVTIRFDGTKIILTTGVSYHTFVLSKEADAIWDRVFSKYLSDKGVEHEIL